MLGNRAVLKKQRREQQKEQKQQSTIRQSFQANNYHTISPITPFTLTQPTQTHKNIQLPQMTFKEQQFDEDRYIRELVEEVDLGGWQYEDERMVEYSIEELDQLVDFTLGEYVVEEFVRRTIRDQIQEIWGEFRVNNTKTQLCKGMEQAVNHNMMEELFHKNKQQTLSFIQLIKNFNQSTSQLIISVQNLNAQNKQLRQTSLNQQTQFTLQQTQFHQLKHKYLQTLKEFTEFKQQTHDKQITLTQTLQDKQFQLIQLGQNVRKLEVSNQLLQGQLQVMKQRHQLEICELRDELHKLYSLEIMHFIALVNSHIVACQKPLVTIFNRTTILQQQQQEQKNTKQLTQLSPTSTSFNQTQTLNSLSSHLDSLLSHKFTPNHQLIQNQSTTIHTLKQLLSDSHQFIQQVNSLDQYQLKVLKKDMKKLSIRSSLKSDLQDLQYEGKINEEDLESLISEIIFTIKTQMVNQAKISQKILSQLKEKDNLITKMQIKINQLTQETQPGKDLPLQQRLTTCKKLLNNFSKQPYNPNTQSITGKTNEKSPIQMLNHPELSQQKLSVNKSTHNYNQESQLKNQVNQFCALEQEQVISGAAVESFKAIEKKDQQLLQLKLQNQTLRQQIQTLKAQLQTLLLSHNNKQPNSKPTTTQRIGKIKRTSTNTSLTKLQHTTNYQQNNKQNIMRQSNKLITPNQPQASNNQKCLNPTCKLSNKKLQTKLNHYKQNIINLNEIVNYFINHLKGYHFGTLTHKTDKFKLDKTNTMEKNKNKQNNSGMVDSYGNSLPVRKYSYLDGQLEQNTHEQESIEWNNTRLNTTSSINQTIKSTAVYHMINPKPIGKITSIHQSLNNTQTLPYIKPHITQQSLSLHKKIQSKKHKLLSKDTIKTNYQNFEFIRKLCLKQGKCKQLISKFHDYLEFYFDKIKEMDRVINEARYEGNQLNQLQRNDTIELENAYDIWQQDCNDEIPYFEPQYSHNSSNYGIKVRSLNSSHRFSHHTNDT